MENKNKKLFIIVGVLLVVGIGATLAYFLTKSILGGNVNVSTDTKTASINGGRLHIDGELEFNDLDIYPGHKNVSKIVVTATGTNQLLAYKLVWKGINSLNTSLKYYVYKSSVDATPTIACTKKNEMTSLGMMYFEECTESGFETLGTMVASGSITSTSVTSEFTLVDEEIIKCSDEGTKEYYYVILEYPNLDESQNIDMDGSFTGEVTIEASEATPDIHVNKIFVDNKEVSAIPGKTDGYVFNTGSSTCTNGATPIWESGEWYLRVDNLSQTGTDCNLYFDKPTSASVVEKLGITNVTEQTDSVPNFASAATSNEGVFKTSDGMYGGDTYYWRGAVDNNHVIFADKCWKMVRINGDGSIRLIYNGTPSGSGDARTCKQASDATSIAKTSQKYNASYDKSYYVGWTYGTGQRPADNNAGSPSNIKTQTESWYKTNITDKGFDGNVATGKFCNDRNTGAGYTWAQSGSTFYYVGYDRSGAKSASSVKPVTTCPEGDVYEMKAGAITMDEVNMAGGKWGKGNSSYYLYNNQYYWTMSPYSWGSSHANVFRVHSDGRLYAGSSVSDSNGVRPVINLRSDTVFASGGSGQANTPFVVE